MRQDAVADFFSGPDISGRKAPHTVIDGLDTVEDYVYLDTHGLFICSIVESRVITKKETMTYTYYQNNVKPKPETEGKKGYVCKVCGYVYEGDELPEDFVCPLCKHGASDFEPIE